MSDSFEIDFNRTERLGFPEVIFGASKPLAVLGDILQSYKEKGLNALATKVQPSKGVALAERFPGSFYDEISGIFALEDSPDLEGSASEIAILSAGTSDAFVVNEAYHTLTFLGCKAKRYNDIGIAGIHRLLSKVDELRRYKVLIVVAGFEGALPTAVGGLLPQPIIAVPASVGYGVSEGGTVALNTMLSSCANGLTVVNIDNGYGAAMAAYRIIQSFA
ncbi:nickel pincer cofactor biosynthesis protein LarB [Pelagicoccus sp. SDUM812002]|uniref:nickel pincer cofactor biosynthesis protein LarB n=1 Tax=Pelagicoccus sp. SDUM812002 TaxID=3041266 RepID=UPI00280E9FB6|nr:nickel pincer cofactor biosynthesis protein LarB [Pelagicoccus sp. SDUM812002]MDQ8187944.1 nickel pincer cofactor biosynthesis protein LarB [Pelagicoccus sp. SDUM812002]